jgi:hypothetical protein
VGQMSGPKIGIVARGSSSFVNDKNRGFDLKAVVAAMPKNASYIVLQTDLSDDEHVFIDSVTTFLHPVRSLSLFPIWPRYVSILLR